MEITICIEYKINIYANRNLSASRFSFRRLVPRLTRSFWARLSGRERKLFNLFIATS